MADDNTVWDIAWSHVNRTMKGVAATLNGIPESAKPQRHWHKIIAAFDEHRKSLEDLATVHKANQNELLLKAVEEINDKLDALSRRSQ